MSWAYDAVHSYAGEVLPVGAREVSCRVRAGEVARPPSSSVGKRRGFTPRSRERLHVRSGRTGGSPASIRRVVESPAHRMEFGAVGGAGPPPWYALAGPRRTVAAQSDSVISASTPAFRPTASRKTPGKRSVNAGQQC